jgi:rubrerythrin
VVESKSATPPNTEFIMATKKLTQAEQDAIYTCKHCGKLKGKHHETDLRCPMPASEGEEVQFHPENTYQLILRYRCKHCGKVEADHQAGKCPIKSTSRTFLHFHPEQKYEPTEKNPVKVRFVL